MQHEHWQDSFNDNELTNMAIEIMKDISTETHLDPKDPFILSEDKDESINYIMSKLPSLSQLSSCNAVVEFPSKISLSIDNSSSESFSDSHLLDIDTTQSPIELQHRKRTNGRVILKSPNTPPPPHLPTSTSTDKSISTSTEVPWSHLCISSRRRSKKNNVTTSTIPDFTANINVNKFKYKSKKKKTSNKYNKGSKGRKKRIQKIVSPLIIDKDYNINTNQRDVKPQTVRTKRSETNPVLNMLKKSKKRANSITLSMTSTITYNSQCHDEYVIEVDDSFMFVTPRGNND